VRSSLLSGFVQLDGLLGSPESNQAGAGIVLRLVTFPLAPGQFLAQLPEPFVHTAQCAESHARVLGKGLPKW
jgi:hypothetical protein